MSPKLRTRNEDTVMMVLEREYQTVTVGEPVVETFATEPWNRRQAVGFAVSTVFGAGLLGAAYFGVSAEVHLKDQVPFLDVGIAGLLVGAAGGVRWLAVVVKAVRGRKAAATALVRSRFAPVGAVGAAGMTEGLVATPRMTRYHRPACSLAAGKDVSAATLAEHSAAGRRPCGVCAP